MNNDQLVKVAYMYYVDNISQKDIAKEMNTSRANIARMLRLCREKKIVEIKINNESSYETFLALDLKSRFNLKDVTVIPDTINNEEAMIQVGKSGAAIVDRLLEDGAGIGISLGTTLYHFVSNMPTSYHQNVSVVQLVGGSQARPFKTDGINLVDTLATKLGAKAYLIHDEYRQLWVVVRRVDNCRNRLPQKALKVISLIVVDAGLPKEKGEDLLKNPSVEIFL